MGEFGFLIGGGVLVWVEILIVIWVLGIGYWEFVCLEVVNLGGVVDFVRYFVKVMCMWF